MFGPKRTLMTGVLGFASGLGGWGCRADHTDVDRGPWPAGSFRRPAGTVGVVPADLDLHRSQGSEVGPWDLRHHRHRRFGLGLILGGFLTRVRRLALVPLRQLADRRHLSLFGAFTMIPEREGVHGVRLDVLGVILGCGGLVSLVYGLGEAGARADGVRPTSSWPLVLAGLLLTALRRLVRARGPTRSCPLRGPANRNRAGSFLTIFAGGDRDVRKVPVPTYLLQPRRYRRS